MWKKIINSLPSDYFRAAELGLFSAYIMASVIYDRAMAKVHEQGMVLEVGSKGYKVVNPALTIASKQTQIMCTLATKLRLAPNSRVTKWKANTTERVKSKRPGLMFGEDED